MSVSIKYPEIYTESTFRSRIEARITELKEMYNKIYSAIEHNKEHLNKNGIGKLSSDIIERFEDKLAEYSNLSNLIEFELSELVPRIDEMDNTICNVFKDFYDLNDEIITHFQNEYQNIKFEFVNVHHEDKWPTCTIESDSKVLNDKLVLYEHVLQKNKLMLYNYSNIMKPKTVKFLYNICKTVGKRILDLMDIISLRTVSRINREKNDLIKFQMDWIELSDESDQKSHSKN